MRIVSNNFVDTTVLFLNNVQDRNPTRGVVHIVLVILILQVYKYELLCRYGAGVQQKRGKQHVVDFLVLPGMRNNSDPNSRSNFQH